MAESVQQMGWYQPRGYEWYARQKRAREANALEATRVGISLENLELAKKRFSLDAFNSQMSQHKYVIDAFTKAYNEAPDVVTKEEYRKKAIAYTQNLPPVMQRGLQGVFSQSPFSVRERQKADYIKQNPRPLLNADPVKAPALYAQQKFSQMDWDKRAAKTLYNQDVDTPALISIDSEIYAVRGADNQPKLVKAEVLNSPWLQEYAKGHNTTAEQLIMDGGNLKPQINKVQMVGEDGDIREAMVTSQYNVFSQKTSHKLTDVAKSPRGERPFSLPPTDKEKASIEAAIISALQGNVPSPERDKVSWETSLLAQSIVDARKEYAKDSAGFQRWFSDNVSNYSPNYTFVVRGKAETEAWPMTKWFPKISFGNDYTILRVPGKRQVVPLKDAEVNLIVSRQSDAVFNTDGTFIGRDVNAILERLSNMTIEEVSKLETGEGQ
jgi:hypothetical protein